jgi:TetR/AcrR family transcriptional repressor of nem operon
MPEPVRSREAAKRETREALLRAGIAEFSERGLAEPSLDGICSRAGYTRGAFYVHFRDRDDFISVVMERVLGAFLDAVIATGRDGDDLEQTVLRFAGALESGSAGLELPGAAGERGLQFHRVLEACARSPAIRGRFSAILEEAGERVARAAAVGQRSGTLRPDVDAEAVGVLLVALALGAINALEVGMAFDPARAAGAVLSLLRR